MGMEHGFCWGGMDGWKHPPHLWCGTNFSRCLRLKSSGSNKKSAGEKNPNLWMFWSHENVTSPTWKEHLLKKKQNTWMSLKNPNSDPKFLAFCWAYPLKNPTVTHLVETSSFLLAPFWISVRLDIAPSPRVPSWVHVARVSSRCRARVLNLKSGTENAGGILEGKKFPSLVVTRTLKLTVKAPENRSFQKETSIFQPSIFRWENVGFRECNGWKNMQVNKSHEPEKVKYTNIKYWYRNSIIHLSMNKNPIIFNGFHIFTLLLLDTFWRSRPKKPYLFRIGPFLLPISSVPWVVCVDGFNSSARSMAPSQAACWKVARDGWHWSWLSRRFFSINDIGFFNSDFFVEDLMITL